MLDKWGFKRKGLRDHLRAFDLDQVRLSYDLEPGYKVQDVRVDRDFRARAETIFLAFNPDKPFEESNIPYWESTRGAPGYRPELELSVVDHDGRVITGCLGWVYEAIGTGEIEPVGTHPSIQRRGFGTAMVIECFKRMKERGIKFAYIGSGLEPAVGNRLYESLNPVEKIDHELWTKNFNATIPAK